MIPSLDCAVELLDVFSAMEVVPDGQRLQIGELFETAMASF